MVIIGHKVGEISITRRSTRKYKNFLINPTISKEEYI